MKVVLTYVGLLILGFIGNFNEVADVVSWWGIVAWAGWAWK